MITSPVFIIGCPRSGSTLLFRTLAQARPLWSIGGESRHIIERHHHPSQADWVSGALTTADVCVESKRMIRAAFQQEAAPWSFWIRVNRLRAALDRRSFWRELKRRRAGQGGPSELAGTIPRAGISAIRTWVRFRHRFRFGGNGPGRLLEKTPENCLRLPFLLEVFPDARIIHLVRDGRSNTSSLMEGWRRRDLFPGYRLPDLIAVPGVPKDRWAFTLIPGWRDLASRPLEEVCARQWIACNEAVLDFFRGEGSKVPHLRVRYEDLTERFDEVLQEIALFADVELQPHPERALESNIVSPPSRDKWRSLHGEEIGRVETLIAPTMASLGYRD